MKPVFRKLLLIAAFAFPIAAQAGPWCLVRDAVENCRFLTADQCYQFSNREGGYCKPNPRELGVVGRAPFCVLTAGEKRCTFYSRTGCLRQAMAVEGGCVRNTELDLARRARGEAAMAGCIPGTPDCPDEGFRVEGLEAAGYTEPAAVQPMESFEPVEPIGDF